VVAVLQVGSHKSGVEGRSLLPQPSGDTSLDATHDTVGFLGCKSKLLAHVESTNSLKSFLGLLLSHSLPNLYLYEGKWPQVAPG